MVKLWKCMTGYPYTVMQIAVHSIIEAEIDNKRSIPDIPRYLAWMKYAE